MNMKSVLLTAAMAAVSASSFADVSQPERHGQAACELKEHLK